MTLLQVKSGTGTIDSFFAAAVKKVDDTKQSTQKKQKLSGGGDSAASAKAVNGKDLATAPSAASIRDALRVRIFTPEASLAVDRFQTDSTMMQLAIKLGGVSPY